MDKEISLPPDAQARIKMLADLHRKHTRKGQSEHEATDQDGDGDDVSPAKRPNANEHGNT